MDFTTIILTILGIVIGAVASYIISQHFFKKSVKQKKLSVYIQFNSRLFSRTVDTHLQKDLVVNYKNHAIENIMQAQFVIANTGDIAIRDIIRPLRLNLPKKNVIYNVTIEDIKPEGRIIEHKIVDDIKFNVIEFNIPLLNCGDYFVFKLVAQDFFEKKNDNEEEKNKVHSDETLFDFTITADDIPPNIRIEQLPYTYYEDEKVETYDWAAFWGALIISIIDVVLIGVVFSFRHLNTHLYLFSFNDFFDKKFFSFYSVCVLLLSIVAFVLLIISVIMWILAIEELKPKEKPKFKLPKRLDREKKYFYNIDKFS